MGIHNSSVDAHANKNPVPNGISDIEHADLIYVLVDNVVKAETHLPKGMLIYLVTDILTAVLVITDDKNTAVQEEDVVQGYGEYYTVLHTRPQLFFRPSKVAGKSGPLLYLEINAL